MDKQCSYCICDCDKSCVCEIQEKAYRQGAREFAEWLEKHAIVTIQDGVTTFCDDEDKRPHGYSELLAEWQKGEKND